MVDKNMNNIHGTMNDCVEENMCEHECTLRKKGFLSNMKGPLVAMNQCNGQACLAFSFGV